MDKRQLLVARLLRAGFHAWIDENERIRMWYGAEHKQKVDEIIAETFHLPK